MTIAEANARGRTGASRAALGETETPVVPNYPLSHFIFESVSWSFYTRTLEELDRCGQHARVTFDRGRMEIMTVGRRHEMIKKAIGRLIEVYADETGISIEGVGNVTCSREDLDRGLEPDECYYVTSEYRGLEDHLDLRNNPPPDLAVEVEVSVGLGTRRVIYAELGVPERWRFDGARVIVMALLEGNYRPVDRSRCFPDLDIAEFSQFVLRAIANQRTAVPEYRNLLRSRKGKNTP